MSAEAHLQKAQSCLNAGLGQDALTAAQQALQAQPQNGNAVYLMAAALRMLNRLGEAETLLQRLNAAMPGQPDILNMLGLTLRDQGRPDEARRVFEAGLNADPRHPIWGNLGLLLQDHDAAAAEAHYRRMIDSQPADIEPRAMLAAFLVSQSRAEEAAKLADAVLADCPDHLTARSARAAADLAQKNPQAARDRLDGYLVHAEGPALNLALAWRRLAQAHDRLDETGLAFAAWMRANRIQRSEWVERWETYDGPRSLASARRIRDWFETHTPKIHDGELEGPAPVFQVGFPRSGTTLLENMLDAHPQVESLPEQDTVVPIIEAVGDTPDQLARLDRLSTSQINEMRRAYWSQAKPDGPPNAGHVLVDKYPTNLVWTGVLGRIFPDAKIVVSLRDPRDCVLSCLQQHFGINPEMYRTLDLQDAGALYDACMGAGQAGLKSLPESQVFTLRYEELVEDYQAVLTGLLQHIGLDWHDDIHAYRDRAAKRRITTPSAPQVVRPLYTTARAKWKRYADEMAPILPGLNMWADRLGYGDTNGE